MYEETLINLKGFTNNQIKAIIFMLRTVTEDLYYALELLLPQVIFFIIKDLFGISSKENKLHVDGGIAYDRRTVSTF